jgi:hypothetical protein
MQKQEDKMKALSKAVLEQDQQRKMKAKLRNASYEPWKNPLATTKQTPFGNFPDQKKKELFDFSQKPVDYEPGQASTNVRKTPTHLSIAKGFEGKASQRLWSETYRI